jgi:membrane-bound acyltransferase YfiQ involved in biofilm formation
MPQHYIHTMECYKTFHYKAYMKHKYILFITTLPYRITPMHVITLTTKYPNKDNETDCKFQSNIKDIYIVTVIAFICSFHPATWGHIPQDIEHVKICVT